MSGKGFYIVDELPFETWQHFERWYVAREINGVIVLLDHLEDAAARAARETAKLSRLLTRELVEAKPEQDKAWFRRFEKRRRV
jgi:hypothetical protein